MVFSLQEAIRVSLKRCCEAQVLGVPHVSCHPVEEPGIRKVFGRELDGYQPTALSSIQSELGPSTTKGSTFSNELCKVNAYLLQHPPAQSQQKSRDCWPKILLLWQALTFAQ
jgi:hypothetical protein